MAQDNGAGAVPVESGAQPEEAPLSPGSRAPLFSLADADMETFGLSEALASNIVVLCFYPRDGAPVCTQQAIEFSDHDDEFAREGAVVVGVSPDDVLRHADFRDQHGLSIRLLSDPDFEVSRTYGVLQQRAQGSGQSVRRATFVIDQSGVIRHALLESGARGHAATILELVRQISRNT